MKLVNQALEIKVLRTICSAKEQIAGKIINRISDTTFYYEPVQDAWRRLRAQLTANGSIPDWADICSDPAITETNRAILRRDQQKPFSAASEEKLDAALGNLDRFRQIRSLVAMASEIMDAAEDESMDIEKLLESTSEHLTSARTKGNSSRRILHIGKGNNSTQMVKDLLSKKKMPVVPTGFKAFDEVNGGILLGSLFVIAANTGGGKSTMAINLAHNMTLAGHDTLIVPLEMTEDQMAARLFGLRTGLDVSKVSQHRLAKGETQKVVDDYKAIVKNLKGTDTRLSIWSPEEDMSIQDLLLTVKPYKYKVIIIDYISLLQGADDDDQAKKLGAIARFAKVFAKNNNCVVVLLAQLDDQTKNIRYARAIREHANNAWFWFTPEGEEDETLLDIRQTKARNQRRFNFRLLSVNKSMLITDVDGQEPRNETPEDPEDPIVKRRNKFFTDLEEEAEDDEDDD